MSCSTCPYLLMKFKKLIRGILIAHYGLQILKVSCDLEILDVNVVEIPWNTPYTIPLHNGHSILQEKHHIKYRLLLKHLKSFFVIEYRTNFFFSTNEFIFNRTRLC